jgi:hypothetical protein
VSAVVDRARIRRATLAARAAMFERDAAQAVEALRAEIESEALAWRDFYADLLREAVQRLIDDEIRWRMKAILDEQDEEQAILLMLSEM